MVKAVVKKTARKVYSQTKRKEMRDQKTFNNNIFKSKGSLQEKI